MEVAFSSAVTCAENISLLFLLNPKPSCPIRVPVNAERGPTVGYSLPFEKERSLASTLAFLCSIRDDPGRIPALCIEENANSAGLNIIVAVNKSSWDGGRGYLQAVQQGLEKTMAVLSQVTDVE